MVGTLPTSNIKKSLTKYVKFLKANKSKGCQLIYSLITPVSSKELGVKLDPVRNQVVIDRNRIARKVMEESGIQVIDLYDSMEPDMEKYNSSKGDL